jgi:TonB-dependent starch-binding outer membrane protein SusC
MTFSTPKGAARQWGAVVVLSALLPLSSYAQAPLATAEASLGGAPAASPPAASPVKEQVLLRASPRIIHIPYAQIPSLSPTAYAHISSKHTGVLVDRKLTPTLSLQEQLRAIPGVQVTPYSGMPGAWAAVRIRGAASAFGNPEPLYILDGFPVFMGNLGPGQNSGINQVAGPMPNPLLTLSTEDIARVEVLSGAAGTARYGSQGANGVVVLTTRRGLDQSAPDSVKFRVRYAAHLGVQQVRRRYELLDAKEYAALHQEAQANGYQTVTPGSVDTPTDWQREIFRTALIQQHYVALDGRSKRGPSYTISADYLRQDGVVRESNLRRFTGRATAEQRLMGNRLTLLASVLGSQTDERRVEDYVVNSALYAPPTQPVRAADGRYNMGTAPDAPAGFTNPVMLADYSYQTPRTRTLLAQGTAQYAFSEELNLTVRTGYERTRTALTDYRPEYVIGNSAPTRALEYRTTDATTTNKTIGVDLVWQRSVGANGADELGLEASLLWQKVGREVNSQQISYLLQPPYQPIPVYNNQQSGLRGIALSTPGFFAHYVWHKGLTAELGARLSNDPAPFDGPVQNHVYPNAQLSWQVGKISAFSDKPVLKDLVLWAGAGRTGAANLGQYAPAQVPQYSNALGGGIGAVAGNLTGARGVYVDQVEVGSRVEWAGFWRGSLTAYSRTSYSQSVVGVLFPTGSNLADPLIIRADQEVRNRGLEVAITRDWYSPGRASGRTTLAVSLNQNRVLKDGGLNNNQLLIGQQQVAGQPLSAFYGYQQQGIYPVGDPRAGYIRYVDRNGDGRAGTLGDATYLGSGLPRQLVSLTQNLRKGRWSADVQIDGMFGYQVFTYARLPLDVPTGNSNSTSEVRDHWSPQNPDSDIPSVAGAYASTAFSERVISSGSHVRLTQAIVSFEVWKDYKKNRTVSVWTGGLNLFVVGPYKGFDPNISTAGATGAWAGHDNSAYPVARTFQLGVRATL